MDFAKRAHDHSFPFDPIVRSLLDTDFYKLLMLQFIWERHRQTYVRFAMINRTKTVRLAEEIDETDLRAQLDHVTTLRWQRSELIWLAGQTFYGQAGIFKPEFIAFLRDEFILSDYSLRKDAGTGQWLLSFAGPWVQTTLWEIYSLTITNELRYRKKMRSMTRAQLDIMYARAKVKLYAKLERLAELDGLNLSEFGTRRRHSFLWQQHVVQTMCDVLGDKFVGTSNCYLAMTLGLEAKGTNAHEVPMVYAALAETQEDLKGAQYKVLEDWQDSYDGALRVALPDTFGTTQFLADAPPWLTDWTGYRPDSKDPIVGGEELIDWWRGRNADPAEKLILFSDGLDVAIDGFEPQGADIVEIYHHFHGRVRDGYGWGTMATNDFIGCHPLDPNAMKAISLVCKVESANGRPAVKLSDNYNKATGPAVEVERYRATFGTAGQAGAPVTV